jgi:hypothetical protein
MLVGLDLLLLLYLGEFALTPLLDLLEPLHVSLCILSGQVDII